MGCNNDRRRLVPPLPPVVQPVEKRTETSKPKSIYINAKIEDVGLTELKKYRNKKWSLYFHDNPKHQYPIYCFLYCTGFRVSNGTIKF